MSCTVVKPEFAARQGHKSNENNNYIHSVMFKESLVKTCSATNPTNFKGL